ncbi:MAG TPA: FAD-dependent 5-carboxymethylaminomethyl-2-thiouridine(34) oxidoreductase MnmC [Burkholderiaceae bacterium]|nr:FAD-dependent 5-carboxymethylaminomethyl-2-thiouridine(34) oxidoreductase MnmC [Burkholderiaceae bacterium]
MKAALLRPATIAFDRPDGVPWAPEFGDVYHPASGAFAQARHVFLQGNGLPMRWQGQQRFAILETGFGLGMNFLATWQAWRDAAARPERLVYVALELHPPRPQDLARAHAASPAPDLSRRLVAAWPPCTPGLHVLDFEDGRVRLLLGLGEATVLARRLVGRFDALYLDGFAPARNAAMWTPELFRALARLCAPGCTAATWSAARAVREGLAAAGFSVESAPGQGGKREMTRARFAPRFVPPAPPGRVIADRAPPHALVIGAGLAGAATALALSRAGIPSTVIDRHATPAAEASGNPAGIFHGSVAPGDGPHARVHRAAALRASVLIGGAVAAGVPGAVDGLLRVQADGNVEPMQALAVAQALDPRYVQALDAEAAHHRSGAVVREPAWWYPGGGWVDPGAWVRHALAVAGARCRFGGAVSTLARDATGWRAYDDAGRVLAEAPLAVLANGSGVGVLAGWPAHWLQRRRGQLTLLPPDDVAGPRPAVPLAGRGYAIACPDGRLLIGATNTGDDEDATLRPDDHAQNLGRVAPWWPAGLCRADAPWDGRVGWRVTTRDRLPLAGLAPDLQASLPARRDAARLLARRPGLLVHTALGSRGIALSLLAADLIAAQAAGAPWPLEADLVDAIDPARFVLRQS